ncbi:MAG: glycoside hydrolase [Betaproteobacteria bacterium]|nr:glycoside hydrolase [Betaproteobacteria bacterium]
MHAVDLVLAWHMHQPDYRDPVSGEFRLPWVYLHAIKDYSDMAGHLERHPGVRVVVNFVPVLLDQLQDYGDQFASGELRDPLLRLLGRSEATALTPAERRFAIELCFHANHERMVKPFPAYRRLYDLFCSLEPQGASALEYLSDRFFYDLLVWYHLAWTGETLRRGSEPVARLMALGEHFSEAQRRELLELIGRTVRSIVPRYRALAEAGRVELSTTPYFHPIAPLLIDFGAARDAQPEIALPASSVYPGGRERSIAQLQAAREAHERHFGAQPAGLWPAEGAVSRPFAQLAAEQGFAWLASSQSVLGRSLARNRTATPADAASRHRPYRLTDCAANCALFFRDDRLSDLIGFQYAKWHGQDAAVNFISELEAIGRAVPAAERPLVSVILDGENAWEYYPYNGYYFFEDLYGRFETDAAVRTHTFSSYLAAHPGEAGAADGFAQFGALDNLAAGSWIAGNFSTWIGSTDKNHAWDLLCAAKQSLDLVFASGRLDGVRKQAALRQLGDCEASDWFWWFGDYNPAAAVASFDRLYRGKLRNLYQLLELPAPAALDVPISRGRGEPELGGAMRRSG